MLQYIARRLLIMIPTLLVISFISFIIIQLPPGDYLTSYMAKLAGQGDEIDQATIESLRVRYGFDEPVLIQYVKWLGGILQGDFGYSFEWNQPVNRLIWERLLLTLAITTTALLFSWLIAFPIGFFSAVRQHSVGDYFATFWGFIGVAIPDFLLALILMYVSLKYLGINVTGLFSEKFVDADWSLERVFDMFKHLWVPLLIISTHGTAHLIRVMRNNLLDELPKPYVMAARARGLDELTLLLKYPVRVAINPFLSTAGWLLPGLVSGSTIIAVVLNIPTEGPMLLKALLAQDMYLAGTFTMLLATLTVVGTLISDTLLAIADPRIRFD